MELTREPQFSVVFEYDVPMRTRDGVILYSDIARPNSSGRFPVILSRTPYSKELGVAKATARRHCHSYAAYGYVTVLQDCRGRFGSEGEYEPLFQEVCDGYDAVEWAADLAWSNGRVGTAGQSYLAMTQYAILCGEELPEALETMVVLSGSSNPYASWVFHTGGASMFGWNMAYAIQTGKDTVSREGRTELWDVLDSYVVDDPPPSSHGPAPLREEWFRHLPINEWGGLLKEAAPYYANHLSHPTDGEFWWRNNVSHHAEKVQIPILHVSSWYDIFSEGAPAAFAAIRDSQVAVDQGHNQALIMGPWHHDSFTEPNRVVGDMDFGPAAARDMHAVQLAWFDRWLKDKENPQFLVDGPVEVFTMGINRWQSFRDWPPQVATSVAYYLHSGGSANSACGDGTLSSIAPRDEPVDSYVYDPSDPVPTCGGANLSIPMGVMDQRPVEYRSDVLVYTTHALGSSLEVSGQVFVILWASSSATDTDFVAKLVDVHPDGYAQNLLDGIVRATYRDGANGDAGSLLPDEAYCFTIELGNVSTVFLQGHRMRLEVSSSNFPRFDRNLNTGECFGRGEEWQVAMQRIWHCDGMESRLVLPVVPE